MILRLDLGAWSGVKVVATSFSRTLRDNDEMKSEEESKHNERINYMVSKRYLPSWYVE
jgi:hypothetical protein